MSKDKYDRQTRLWGESQILISAANILCFNSDSLAADILKNLVLSGIGKINIVDNTLINDSDFNSNFYLNNKNQINELRSKIILENLLELNTDCKGEYFNESPENFIVKDPSLSNYDLIFSCNQTDDFNSKVFEIVKKSNKRLIIVNSCGLFSYIRLYENYHANMSLRLSDNPVIDYRLSNPWDELFNYCKEFNFSQVDDITHKNIPYFVILVNALIQYREIKKEPNANPSNMKEKEEFKNIIKSMIRNNDEENFTEALSYFYYCNKDCNKLITDKLDFIFNILKNNSLDDLLKKSNNIMKLFFIYCKCLMEFYEEYNSFPLVGSIPDMSSATFLYTELKKIYTKKAQNEREIMKKKVNDFISKINFDNKNEIINMINNTKDENYIDIIDILNKNWPQFSLFVYNNNYYNWKIDLSDFMEDYQVSNFKWYVLFKASDMFFKQFNRYPGTISDFKSDIEPLKSLTKEIINHFNEENKDFNAKDIADDFIFEFCRMGKGHVPPCESITASISSQEAIKLITYQFQSVNSTIIYDGVNVFLSTFKI